MTSATTSAPGRAPRRPGRHGPLRRHGRHGVAAGAAAAATAAAVTAAAVTAAVALAGCGPPPPSGAATDLPPPETAAPVATVPALSSSQDALSEARRFVFRVRNAACLATGTAFAYSGTIVTNRHVAAGARQLDLATWNGDDFSASVGGHGASADLARLDASPPGAGYTPPAAGSDPAVGARVYVTGYPEGDQLTVTSGTVLGTTSGTDLGVSGPVLVISDRVQPGNSGSPLLDAAGRVVGVVFALETGTGHGLAMPLSTLRSFLAGGASYATLACTE